jgi:hypothetical protein
MVLQNTRCMVYMAPCPVLWNNTTAPNLKSHRLTSRKKKKKSQAHSRSVHREHLLQFQRSEHESSDLTARNFAGHNRKTEKCLADQLTLVIVDLLELLENESESTPWRPCSTPCESAKGCSTRREVM